MKYGHLTVICGPMFAGKTTEMLKRILWAKNGQQRRALVFKPTFDTRYSKEDIVSHEGLRATAENLSHWPSGTIEADIVFLDEVQFMAPPQFEGDIIQHVRDLLEAGIDVVAGGLDSDWQGRAFPVVGELAAMADEVVKLKSVCAVCGRPASKTYKKSGEGSKVELGGAESYEPRCIKHWAERTENPLFPGLLTD